jgi:acetyl esterase/lipase
VLPNQSEKPMSLLDTLFHSDEAREKPEPDSDMQVVLDALAALGGKPIETLTAEEARKQPTPADAAKRVLMKNGDEPTPDGGVTTHEITIKGAAGDLPARVYRPKSEDGALPVIVYFHGGGWVIANIDVYDASPRAIAKAANAVVVSCEYRLAPEHKFPAAHDDAFAAYKFVLANAGAFGGDQMRVAVMGESAGGNLAINVAMRARDEGIAAPKHMALIYPVAGNDMQTASYQQNANAKPLNKPMMEWFVKQTFESKEQTSDPRINLVKANLNGLPSATIILAEIDPLRSEGRELGRRLKEAGSDVNMKMYQGVTHEFFGMGLVVDDAKTAEGVVADDLSNALS